LFEGILENAKIDPFVLLVKKNDLRTPSSLNNSKENNSYPKAKTTPLPPSLFSLLSLVPKCFRVLILKRSLTINTS
jgi:hypothetical protein